MSKRKKNKSNDKIKELQRQYIIAYYKRNPDVFVERELEVKLHKWQKLWLKFIFRRGFKNEGVLQDQEGSVCNQE